MKLFGQYLWQRRRVPTVGLGFFLIFLLSFWLYHLPVPALLYPALLCLLLGAALTVADFFRVKRKHDTLIGLLAAMDDLTDRLPLAEGIEEEDYQRLLRQLDETRAAHRTESNQKYADMIRYYTVWAHQIKTPIASMRLRLQNEDTALSRSVSSDLFRIEQYVEMVLAFLRLDAESTDYVLRETALDPLLRQTFKRFAGEFIGRRLTLRYEPVDATVITDEKWLSFVIEQVLSNALKYTPSGGITVTWEPGNRLCIRDTGIGIAPEDLPRIFENGFTGYNGRADRKANGIGLYLCRRVCANLGHTIHVTSTVGEGTAVFLDLTQARPEAE